MQWLAVIAVVAALSQPRGDHDNKLVRQQFSLSDPIVGAVNAQLAADHNGVRLVAGSFTLVARQITIVSAWGDLQVECAHRHAPTTETRVRFVVEPRLDLSLKDRKALLEKGYSSINLTRLTWLVFVEKDLRMLGVVYQCLRDIALDQCRKPASRATPVAITFSGNEHGAAFARKPISAAAFAGIP